MSGRSRARPVAVVVTVAVVAAGALLWATRKGGDGTRDRAPVVPSVPATEPPPRYERPRTERERLERLVEVLLHADTEDALWARGKLIEAGDEARALVVSIAESSLTSNVAFVEHAFDVLLADPRASDLPLAASGLRSADPEVVRRACLLLGRLGPAARTAVPDLGQTAAGAAHPVPYYACDALAKIGGDEAVEALARVARSEGAGPTARAQAILALGRLGGRKAVEILRKLWEEATGDERVAAAQALITAGDRTPVEALRAEWTSRRDEISLALLAYAVDDLALRELAARLRDPLETAVRKVEAIGRLERYPAERKTGLLREIARDPRQERDVRVEAWDALVRCGDPADEADLLRLLRAEGASAQDDRYVAALVLGRLRRPGHARVLLEAAARDDVGAEVRTKILCALALTGSPDGAEALVAAFVSDGSKHEDSGSASVDLGAVLERPPPELRAALAPLVLATLRQDALRSGKVLGPRARHELVVLAGRVCGSEAAAVVEPLLAHPDRHVRAAAARVLALVGGRDTERALRAAWWAQQDPYTRTAIAETLLRLSLDAPVR